MNLFSKSVLLRNLEDLTDILMFLFEKFISEIHEYSQKFWEI